VPNGGVSVAKPTSTSRPDGIEPKLEYDLGVSRARTTPKQPPRCISVFFGQPLEGWTEAHGQLCHPPSFYGVMVLVREFAMTCEVTNVIGFNVP
jgi:hypothetical protein